MKKIISITALAAAVICMAGCVSTKKAAPKASAKKPSPAAPAPKASAPHKAVPHAESPATLSVPLASNPSTGFSWACDVANPVVAELSDIVYKQNPAPKDMVGVGGTEYFVFTCKEPGSTALTFTYRRPWKGGETAEVRRAQLVVDDKLDAKITFY